MTIKEFLKANELFKKNEDFYESLISSVEIWNNDSALGYLLIALSLNQKLNDNEKLEIFYAMKNSFDLYSQEDARQYLFKKHFFSKKGEL